MVIPKPSRISSSCLSHAIRLVFLKTLTFWLCAAALVALAGRGVLLIIAYGGSPAPYPVDAYYYLSKAENLAAGKGLTTYWNGGVDRKFFPLQSFALAPFAPLRTEWPHYWLILSVALYLLNAAVLARLLWKIEPAGLVRFGALAFWLCNSNILKWSTVPYAESLASLLIWGAVLLCADGWRRIPVWRFLSPCFVAGLALTARAEAVMLLLAFAGIVAVQWARQGTGAVPWKRLGLGAALFAAPFCIYWLSLPAGGSAAKLSYVQEFWSHFSLSQIGGRFLTLFATIHFESGLGGFVAPYQRWIQTATVAVSWIGLVLGLAGRLGRRTQWACVTLVAYQFLHAFWHYSYERFNFIAVPLAAYVLARTAAAIARTGRRGGLTPREGEEASELSPARAAVCGAAVFATAAVAGVFAQHAIDRHQYFLDKEPSTALADRQEAVQAMCFCLREGEEYVSSDDLWFVYAVGAHTGAQAWIDQEKRDFFPAAFQPGETIEFLKKRRIRLIATPRTLNEWLDHFQIPADQRSHFTVKRDFPTFRILEWNGLDPRPA